MADPTPTPITGRFLLPDGSAPVNGKLHIRRVGFDTALDAVVLDVLDPVDLDDTGAPPNGFGLIPNTDGPRGTAYQVEASHRVGARIVNQPPRSFQVGAAASYTWTDLLNTPVPDAPGWNVNLDPVEYAALLASNDAAVAAAAVAVPAAAAAAEDAVRTAADRVQTTADRVQTTADRVQTGLDRTAAEAARDAASLGADVYPDTAAGLAAVGLGGQFQVVVGTDLVRYREDAGPVATEVSRMPTTAAVAPLFARTSGLEGGIIGPEAGYMTTTGLPVDRITYDAAGRAVSAQGSDGLAYEQAADGRMARGTGIVNIGPALGYAEGGQAGIITQVVTDDAGRPDRFRGVYGEERVFTPDGRALDLAPLQITGPVAGWLEDQADALVVSMAVAANNSLIAADVAGTKWAAVEYRQTASGLSRRETPLTPVAPIQPVTGGLLHIPPTRYRRGGRWVSTTATTVESPDPASLAVVGEAFNMRFNAYVWLGFQYIRAPITVTRVSDSATLATPAAYDLDLERGGIEGNVNTADFACTVSYTGYYHRIDIVSVNPVTGDVAITLGTERMRTANMYPAVAPAGHVPLYRVHRSITGAEVQPIHLYRGLVRIDREGPDTASIEEMRRRARPLRSLIAARAAAGTALKWGGYGDSITHIEGTSGPGAAIDNVNPNGFGRDRIAYFTNYAADARALLNPIDLGDGRGVTSVKEGWNWYALKWLIANTKSVPPLTVNYRNWGVGGSTSGAGIASTGRMNGSEPDRLNALVADACDAVCVGFGMNDINDIDSYPGVRTIAEALLNAGTLVALVTPPRPNVLFRERTAGWRITCAAIEAVGDDLGLPVARTARLFDLENLAAAGFAEREMCDATLQNHPGKPELDAIGRLITEFL